MWGCSTEKNESQREKLTLKIRNKQTGAYSTEIGFDSVFLLLKNAKITISLLYALICSFVVIRNISSPDIPFVTVEYSLEKHKILQCYGYHDTKPDDGVIEFVNKKWLPYANRKVRKIQKAAA